MAENKTCGNCLFIVKEQGEPYYCAIRDLYTLRNEEDRACEDWKDGGEDGRE